MARLEIHADTRILARAEADRFVGLARRSIEVRGFFAVALSGGSTPWNTYSLLASEEFAPRVNWGSVLVFWADERCVPPDHSDSNYRMVHEALLSKVPVPPENVFRIRGELPPEDAAAEYAGALGSVPGLEADGFPRFDLVMLGMGRDGHTASLFPGCPALEERVKPVAAVRADDLELNRITLTLPVINNANSVHFLVTGRDKAGALVRVLGRGLKDPGTGAGGRRGDTAGLVAAYEVEPGNAQATPATTPLPASLVKPQGELTWMVDQAAADLLACEWDS